MALHQKVNTCRSSLKIKMMNVTMFFVVFFYINGLARNDDNFR